MACARPSPDASSASTMYFSRKGPAIVALGENETHLWHWQSHIYMAHLRMHRVAAEFIATPGDHHFDITDRLGNARDPLTRALIAQMGL